MWLQNTKSCSKPSNGKTQFISTLNFGSGYTALHNGMVVNRMCTTTDGTLTLAALLCDPLVQLVMRSDNVSESDHTALLYRVRETLASRARDRAEAVETLH